MSSLVTLLSLDFLKLVFIAIVLASPIAWYIMQEWLQGFAYRVDISWQVFALTSFLAVVIALLTDSFQVKSCYYKSSQELKNRMNCARQACRVAGASVSKPHIGCAISHDELMQNAAKYFIIS